MNCNTDTSISEFLAGISLLSVAVHAGIVYFMRPRIVNIRFDPTWNLLDKRTKNIVSSESESGSEDDQIEDTTEIPIHIDTNNKDNGEGGSSFYSYFT